MKILKTKRDVLDLVNSLRPMKAKELCRLLECLPPFEDIVVIRASKERGRKKITGDALTIREFLELEL